MKLVINASQQITNCPNCRKLLGDSRTHPDARPIEQERLDPDFSRGPVLHAVITDSRPRCPHCRVPLEIEVHGKMKATTPTGNLGGFKLLRPPVKEGQCPECAVFHTPELPHDQTSLFWHYNFMEKNGRWPTWNDALAHCTQQMREQWVKALAERGVVVPNQVEKTQLGRERTHALKRFTRQLPAIDNLPFPKKLAQDCPAMGQPRNMELQTTGLLGGLMRWLIAVIKSAWRRIRRRQLPAGRYIAGHKIKAGQPVYVGSDGLLYGCPGPQRHKIGAIFRAND